MNRAHAWRLLPLLGGSQPREDRQFSLRGAVTEYLGLGSPRDVDAVMRSEIGIAAPSWSGLGRAVWLIRVADEAILNRLFPPSLRVAERGAGSGPAFRTRTGMMVCSRDGVAAVTRRAGRDSVFRETLRLMTGSDEDENVLERSRAFRELMLYLPPDHLATAYLAGDRTSPGGTFKPAPWWPAVDRMAVGLYEGEGRIDIAVRASLAAPYQKPKLAHKALDRLLQLPHTTLVASATTIGFGRAYEAAAAGPPSGTVARYLALLAAIQGATGARAGERVKLGPHVILAWDQDLRAGKSAPQFALMVECADGRAVSDQARATAERLIGLMEALEPTVAYKGLSIRTGRHLATAVSYVPLRVRASESRLPFLKLLTNIEPAWAVWHGWLIVALSRDHIERILDAQFGLAPSLATVPDVQMLRRGPAERSVLSIVQADLASDVLEQWLAARESGRPSLLDPVWWQSGGDVARRTKPRLGIGMKVAQEPGVVVVARVYPKTAAEGRLRPGDRIIGIDGRLLSLSRPNADLRAGWAESAAGSSRTLRVQRDGTALDIVLPNKRPSAFLSAMGINPADAVRELASLGRTLQFASFAVLSSDESHYSARLSLRLRPEHLSSAASDNPSARKPPP